MKVILPLVNIIQENYYSSTLPRSEMLNSFLQVAAFIFNFFSEKLNFFKTIGRRVLLAQIPVNTLPQAQQLPMINTANKRVAREVYLVVVAKLTLKRIQYIILQVLTQGWLSTEIYVEHNSSL